ncbi:glycosyltransferase family 39 protein [Geobacter hydrogenophilus]|uniref:hypothetical protein n=1 Tax=Geobacter hydrogenophilus TaxID=40983 RepID=UPI002491720A|nr:hypothetical protein [Geobacter hydrogenophilus]MBT0895210.1 glycosyltransferase family 39 protein [Geobacter hydrogenophilus]
MNIVDDAAIIDEFGVNRTATLWELLKPGWSFYYRPMVHLSYYLDGVLWGMEESFLHLENILIHTANVVLVFLILRRNLCTPACRNSELPLMLSLLFALHPINTEAVNWIAGRTDPMATFFILCSLLFLLKGLQEKRAGYQYLSALLFLLGLFSKEVAVALLPVVAILFYVEYRAGKSDTPSPRIIFKSLIPWGIMVLVMTFALLAHFLFRSDTNNLSKIMQLKPTDWLGFASVSFSILGFYLKKLFLPLPLSFAISSVSRHYLWFGVPALLLLLYIISRKRNYAPYAAGVLFALLPAILAVHARMTWTPVAERYLYLPTAFLVLGMGAACVSISSLRRSDALVSVLWILIPIAAFLTVQRNMVWQDNWRLVQDTIRQSPDFGTLRNGLAHELVKKGDFNEAADQLEAGIKLNSNNAGDSTSMRYNLLRVRLKGKSLQDSRALLLTEIGDVRQAETSLLQILRGVDIQCLSSTAGPMLGELARELIQINSVLYDRNGDPFSLYHNGQMYLIIKEKQKAQESFRRAYVEAPAGAYYKEAAGKLAERLTKK